MKKLILLFPIFLLGITLSKAQTGADATKKTTPCIDGTYQLQMIHSRNQPYFPTNLDKIVTDNRDATFVKYVSLGTEVRLKILPLSEINAPDFNHCQKLVMLMNNCFLGNLIY